jgi:hypothetical protein
MTDAFDKEEISKLISQLKRKSTKDKQCLAMGYKTCSKEQFAKRLISFCQKHGGVVLGENKYNLLRKGQIKYPSSGTYRKVFGSWKATCEYCFGNSNKRFPEAKEKEHDEALQVLSSEIDEVKVVRLMIEFKITSIPKYMKARNSYPEVFPSVGWIIEAFGSFPNLLEVSRKTSIDNEMGKLVRFRMENNGRFPSEKKLEKQGINIKMLKRVFGGYTKVAQISAGLVSANEIKKRN